MSKFYRFIGISYLSLLVCLSVLTQMDVIDLKVYDYFYVNKNLNMAIMFIFYLLNVYFLLIITMRNHHKNNILYVILYGCCVLPLFTNAQTNEYILGFVLPISFMILIVVFRKDKKIKIKDILQNFAIFAIITIIVQFLIFFVRYPNTIIQINQALNIKHYTIISIDLLIYYYVYFKVVTTNDGTKRSILDLFSSKAKGIRQISESSNEVIEFENLKLKQRIIFLSMVYGYQFATLFIVLSIGFINKKPVELCIMLIVFWCGRHILGVSWHSEKLWLCSVVTFISFYVLTLFPINLKITLFGAVSMSSVFAYLLHKIAVYEQDNEELRLIKAYIKRFDIDKTTKDELTERCTLAGLSAEETALAVELFVDKINAKDLATRHLVAVSTIRNKKVSIKKKLLEIY